MTGSLFQYLLSNYTVLTVFLRRGLSLGAQITYPLELCTNENEMVCPASLEALLLDQVQKTKLLG